MTAAGGDSKKATDSGAKKAAVAGDLGRCRGVRLEVDEGVAQEWREAASEGRPKFRSELGTPGSDLDDSWRCSICPVMLHWHSGIVPVAYALLVLVQRQSSASVDQCSVRAANKL